MLGLLCVMYLITYVDRVNISTAAGLHQRELGLSNTQLGFLQSAFGYPYLMFQIFGGWIGDRFGPRRTLFLCGLIWATATILTGFAGGLISLFVCRVLVGIGEGATFPVATRAMQSWTPVGRRGFAQGLTHAFARLGNAITPPIVAWLIAIVAWRGSFVALGCTQPRLGGDLAWSLPRRAGRAPGDHAGRARHAAEQGAASHDSGRERPWGRLTRPDGAGHDRLLLLRLDAVALPDVAAVVLPPRVPLRPRKSALFTSAVFFAGVVGDYLGGEISDRILHRTGQTCRRPGATS